MEDFDFEKIQKLVELSVQHNFLIFEDRKFADIGNTVRMQYSKGIYKINKWANIVNAHPLSGPGCVKGLQEANDEVGISGGRACLLIAQLSSKGSLINEKYTKGKKTTKLYDPGIKLYFDHLFLLFQRRSSRQRRPKISSLASFAKKRCRMTLRSFT